MREFLNLRAHTFLALILVAVTFPYGIAVYASEPGNEYDSLADKTCRAQGHPPDTAAYRRCIEAWSPTLEQQADDDTLARKSDGTPEDRECQTRGHLPTTPEYTRCRSSLAEARLRGDKTDDLVAKCSANLALDSIGESDPRLSNQCDDVLASSQSHQDDATGAERLSLEWAKQKCAELGFKPRTEKFGKCVLQLTE